MSTTRMRPINHIGVSVNDIEAVIQWYTEVMGFRLYGNEIKHIKRSEDPNNGIFKIYPSSLQEVKLAFMATGNGVGFEVFEFLDPIYHRVKEFEYNRGGFFHLCVTDQDPEALLNKIITFESRKGSCLRQLSSDHKHHPGRIDDSVPDTKIEVITDA
ncbi:Fc.00g106030.m01.CDS01 [Cosmosporella sp. VM-42]